MLPSISLPPIQLRNSPFVGLHKELCFITTWPTRNRRGYSFLHAKELSRSELAHRLVVKLIVGDLRKADMVLHRCGNARCHNPYHLYVGGDAENHRDKILHHEAGYRSDSLEDTHRTGSSGVLMPRPPILSKEASRLAVRFAGVTPARCCHADWLHSTFDGYRQLCQTTMSGDVVGAHRKIYALFNGRLDKYDIVSHTCDDRACLNPYHLLISGQQASRRDFDAKHDWRCKVTDAAMALIADPAWSIAELARELGRHPQTIRTYRRELLRDLSRRQNSH